MEYNHGIKSFNLKAAYIYLPLRQVFSYQWMKTLASPVILLNTLGNRKLLSCRTEPQFGK